MRSRLFSEVRHSVLLPALLLLLVIMTSHLLMLEPGSWPRKRWMKGAEREKERERAERKNRVL